jgi:hypothetical protein
MTEATNSNTTYATQILMDFVAYDDTIDEEALKENLFINAFNNRLDAIHTQDFILTEDLLVSIVIRFNMDEDEYDSDEYNEYIGYEEYIWEFIMDRTPPQEDAEVDVDMTSVYALINTAPMIVTAPAA